MRMFLTGLLFVILLLALDANAQFKPSEQQYLEQTNLAFNSGFEQGLRNWTNANGVFSVDSTNFVLGKKSGKVALTAQTLDFSQTLSTGYNTALSGLQGHVAAYAKADFPFQVCALIDGVESNCVNGSGDNKFDFYDIPIVLGSTSLGIKFKSLTSYTGSIYVDGVEYGHKQFVSNVAQSEYVGSLTYTGTNNCAWTTTSTTFANFPIDNDCNTPTVTGELQSVATKIPAFKLPNVRVGTYKIIANSLFYISSGSFAAFRLSDGTNSFGYAEAQDSSTNQSSDLLQGSITYNTAQSDVTFQIQARVNGTALVSPNAPERPLRFDVYYYPPESQIVRQSQELTAETANSWNASFTENHVVVAEDFEGVINCVNNGTGDVICTWPSQTLTEEPTIDCTPFNETVISGSMTCTVRDVSNTQARINLYDANSKAFRNVGYKITVNKSKADYNKSQIVYGQFEQIKSLETPYVYAEGNNGASITANTDINFTEVEDASGLWTSNTTYSPNEDGWYFITGSTGATAAHAGTFYIHDGTSTLFFLAPNNLSATVKPFQGIVYLEASKNYTFRATATFTANNSSDVHRIYIQKWVDTGTLIKNLNQNKNVKCQRKTLTANITTDSTMGDLGFSNLVIGKRYNIRIFARSTFNNTDTMNIECEPSGGGNSYAKVHLHGVNSQSGSAFVDEEFTATNTAMDCSSNSITAGNALIGNQADPNDNTWVRLCELPDNYIETSEF